MNKWSLIWPVLASLLLPLGVAWFVYPTHLPPGFGVFPPQFVGPAPGFNLLVFCIVALLILVVAALYLVPAWFGFKPVTPPPPAAPVPLPWWFWVGAAVTAFFWWLMWARTTVFGPLVYYAFTPLWWGFIVLLDGVVYRRSGGRSLLSSKPRTMLITAVVSLVGWLYFEYFDYFALANWYYPNSTMPQLSHATIVVLFLVAYTTVWPAIFEWYNLLQSFPALKVRWSDGPKLPFPGMPSIVAGLVLIALLVVWPKPFFWAVWVGPLLIFTGILIKANIWSPFTGLANGDWSPFLLMAAGTLFNGFVWELWNFGSAHPQSPVTNPNYWVYNVPYVNVIHIFSEMPLEGYLGYLPFGVMAWVMFIWAGNVFNFNTDIDV